jgi:hypothetical protein
MGKEIKIYITTDDTGKTYLMDKLGYEDNPQLWAVEIGMAYVNRQTGQHNMIGYTDRKVFYVERTTLEKLGMLPFVPKREEKPEVDQEEIADVLLQLLKMVGVYPEE